MKRQKRSNSKKKMLRSQLAILIIVLYKLYMIFSKCLKWRSQDQVSPAFKPILANLKKSTEKLNHKTQPQSASKSFDRKKTVLCNLRCKIKEHHVFQQRRKIWSNEKWISNKKAARKRSCISFFFQFILIRYSNQRLDCPGSPSSPIWRPIHGINRTSQPLE